MRRDALAALGIQLPALPTLALGALPGAPSWAARLGRLGLDVIASGAAADTPESWRRARADVPHRPVKARAGDAAALVAAGCRLVESAGPVPDGAYRLGPDARAVAAVDGAAPEVEEMNAVAGRILAASRAAGSVDLWVAATPGLDRLAPDLVERKLAVLVEAAHQARLAIAKVQFDL
jgi:hypothetical protein